MKAECYIPEVEDSRPPRMVEEKRERHFGRYAGQMSPHEAMARDSMWRSNGERPKAWFER